MINPASAALAPRGSSRSLRISENVAKLRREYGCDVTFGSYKDLCIDAVDPSSFGQFWSDALGLALHHEANGDAFLTGETERYTVWVNKVPESKAVKHRIHLDVHGSSIDELVAAGASVIDADSFRWVVMADPEGGEFCLFRDESPPTYRLYEIVIDCEDHEAISTWWATAIGGRRSADDRGFSYIREIPGAPFEAMSFLPVDEPKRGKNRIHLDLISEDVSAFIDAGAILLRPRDDEIRWDVLADPEGNEFCVFAAG